MYAGQNITDVILNVAGFLGRKEIPRCKNQRKKNQTKNQSGSLLR